MKASELEKQNRCWWTRNFGFARCTLKQSNRGMCIKHNRLWDYCEEIRKGYENRKANNVLRFSDYGGLRRLLRNQLGY